MTRAKDISKIITDADFSGTLDVTGTVTAGAVAVDNITIDATEIDSTSALTLDSAGTISLDADSGSINLLDGGTTHAELINSSNDFVIKSSQSDKDILFKGVDGGSLITALTLDMSSGGTATFNHDIKLFADAIIDCSGNLRLDAENANIVFQDTGTVYGKVFKSSDDFVIKSEINHGDIIFQGFYNGSTITALTLNMGIDGTAQFKDKIQCNSINTGSSTGTLTMFGGGTNKGGTIELSGGNNTGSTGSGIVFKTGASTSSPTENMRIDQYGHVTMPYQSAFLAKPTSNISNLTINVNTTVPFGTEIFDQNSDFASDTFTAPVTGKYQLSLQIRFNQLDVDGTFYEVKISTSNREYINIIDMRPADADAPNYTSNFTILADMDASDTAYVRVKPYNSGASQADIEAANTYFSGFLAC